MTDYVDSVAESVSAADTTVSQRVGYFRTWGFYIKGTYLFGPDGSLYIVARTFWAFLFPFHYWVAVGDLVLVRDAADTARFDELLTIADTVSAQVAFGDPLVAEAMNAVDLPEGSLLTTAKYQIVVAGAAGAFSVEENSQNTSVLPAMELSGPPQSFSDEIVEAPAIVDVTDVSNAAWVSDIEEVSDGEDIVDIVTDFSDSFSETSSATDAIDVQANYHLQVNESVSSADTTSSVAAYQASTTETSSAADSPSADAQDEATVDESVHATTVDTISAIFTLSDEVDESLSAADSTSAVYGQYDSISESVTASDTAHFQEVVVVSETVSSVDDPESQVAFEASVFEAAAAADAVGGGNATVAAIFEFISPSDSPSAVKKEFGTIAESVSAADSVDSINSFVHETLSPSDTVSVATTFASTVTENSSASDSVNAQANESGTVSETASASDTVVSVEVDAEAVSAADFITTQTHFYASVAEIISPVESMAVGSHASVSESVVSSDLILTAWHSSAFINEGITIGDAVFTIDARHHQGNFFFAWVLPTDTTFGPRHLVIDEEIIAATINHSEGNVPTLSVEVRNPRIGLLNGSRKLWAWFSWMDETGQIHPLFFGRLVAIPTNLLSDVCTLSFLAKPLDYIGQKQKVGDAMKVRPFYDRVWVGDSGAGDLDVVLEGYPSLWHVDRVTNEVTASDVISGEDGTEVFLASDAFYDSVDITIDTAPLIKVFVEASVGWTQTYAGIVPLPPVHAVSRSGSLASGWPQTGSSIGGGWSAFQANAQEHKPSATTGSPSVVEVTYSGSWQNTEKEHNIGDTMSVSWNFTVPQLVVPQDAPRNFFQNLALDMSANLAGVPGIMSSTMKTKKSDIKITYAFIDPDPDVQDRPDSGIDASWSGDLLEINGGAGATTSEASLSLGYRPNRKFSEKVAFTLQSDLQAVLTDDSLSASPDYETISLSNSDLNQPIIDAIHWQSVEGKDVATGEIIQTDVVLSYQVCVVPGHASVGNEPAFSVVPGELTTDGGVTWASMGTALPSSIPAYQPEVFVLAGTIVEVIPDFFYNVKTTYQLCVQSGLSGVTPPVFGLSPGSYTNDGVARWVSLGSEPVSLLTPPISDPAARAYFATDRGRWSLEAAICRARARLLYKARSVAISFECQWERGLSLSCRKNATIHDPRLPGGIAIGKITDYTLSVVDGVMIASVKIGCALGTGVSLSPDAGTPEYGSTDYMGKDYQKFDGEETLVDSGDVTYSTPAFSPQDDGLNFPLGLGNGVVSAGMTRDPAGFDVNGNAVPASDPYYRLELRPLDNGPFDSEYVVALSRLTVAKGIDLEASSS